MAIPVRFLETLEIATLHADQLVRANVCSPQHDLVANRAIITCKTYKQHTLSTLEAQVSELIQAALQSTRADSPSYQNTSPRPHLPSRSHNTHAPRSLPYDT